MRVSLIIAILSIALLLTACGGSPPDLGLPSVPSGEQTAPSEETSEPADTSTDQPASEAPADEETQDEIPADESASEEPASSIPTALPSTNGTVIFGITDAAVALKNISQIKVTIGGAQLHHKDADEWVQVSDQVQEFDLLMLKTKGITELLGEANIPTGTYNILRLFVRDVEIASSGTTASAKMPTKTLTYPIDLTIDEGQTSTAVFDFIADKSVFKTLQGRFVFAPLARVETRKSPTVTKSVGILSIQGGTVIAAKDIGMDVNGNMDVGMAIDPAKELSFDATLNRVSYSAGGSTQIETRVGQGSSSGSSSSGSTVNDTWIPCNQRTYSGTDEQKDAKKLDCLREQSARSTSGGQYTLGTGTDENQCDECCWIPPCGRRKVCPSDCPQYNNTRN